MLYNIESIIFFLITNKRLFKRNYEKQNLLFNNLYFFLYNNSFFWANQKKSIVNLQNGQQTKDSMEESSMVSLFYFPMVTENNSIRLSYNKNERHSKYLSAMNESILFNGKINKTTFCFTRLRSYHNPIMIRMENLNDSITLTYKITNGIGEYEPGEVIVNKKLKLTLDE